MPQLSCSSQAFRASPFGFHIASVFVLAGVSTALVVSSLVKRQWRSSLSASRSPVSPGSLSFAIFASDFARGRRGGAALIGRYPRRVRVDSGTTDSEALGAGIRTSLGAFRYIAGIPHFLEHGNDDAGEVIALIVVAFCIVGLLSIGASRPERALSSRPRRWASC